MNGFLVVQMKWEEVLPFSARSGAFSATSSDRNTRYVFLQCRALRTLLPSVVI